MPTHKGFKMSRTVKEIQNTSNVKALKRARVTLALSRKELSIRLNVTPKAIEKYENGRDFISKERLVKILEALELTQEQFLKIKKGKNFKPALVREKKVLTNKDRRSYQKNITKACQVLRSMRKSKGLSQDQASRLCGYSRATIGHIENGRIELSQAKIRHILKSYGESYSKYEENHKMDELRDSIEEYCISRLRTLSDEKLNLLRSLIVNL